MQCTIRVPSSLSCGCETMVNTMTARMQALRDEWMGRGCLFSEPPCGIKCSAPTPGCCQPDAATGQDLCAHGPPR
jgi:hypothetical protein